MDDIVELIDNFRDERNWRQFHNEKDLAISISLEANELLECFQWKESTVALEENIADIREELADVIIYSLMLASNLNLDIEKIVKEKISKNEKKYPIDRAKGKRLKYDKL